FGALGRQPAEHRPFWLPRLRADWVFHIAAGCFLLAWVFFTRWLIARRLGQLIWGGVLLAASLAGAALLLQERNDLPGAPLVVIAEDGVLLRKGNSLSFPPRYDVPVNRGVEARLLFAREEWLQIELAGGEVGWVPRRYAVIDE